MFFLHILILYHLLEEVIFTLYYLYTTTNLKIAVQLFCREFSICTDLRLFYGQTRKRIVVHRQCLAERNVVVRIFHGVAVRHDYGSAGSSRMLWRWIRNDARES